MLQRLVNRIAASPSSAERIKVATGTVLLLTVSGIPIFMKNDRPGHDLFSQEKPEAVILAQETAWRQQMRKE
jgi:hypothetical protein